MLLLLKSGIHKTAEFMALLSMQLAAMTPIHAVKRIRFACMHCAQVRNAFCAVRPPGHHAGPTGVVPSQNDPLGSHGFCIFNNLAVAGAYAVNVHRQAGVRRCASLLS